MARPGGWRANSATRASPLRGPASLNPPGPQCARASQTTVQGAGCRWPTSVLQLRGRNSRDVPTPAATLGPGGRSGPQRVDAKSGPSGCSPGPVPTLSILSSSPHASSSAQRPEGGEIPNPGDPQPVPVGADVPSAEPQARGPVKTDTLPSHTRVPPPRALDTNAWVFRARHPAGRDTRVPAFVCPEVSPTSEQQVHRLWERPAQESPRPPLQTASDPTRPGSSHWPGLTRTTG